MGVGRFSALRAATYGREAPAAGGTHEAPLTQPRGDSWSGVTADEMRNTGPLTASFGAKGFLQPGLEWSGTSTTATIHLVVVALY